jgi:hypothetical protein
MGFAGRNSQCALVAGHAKTHGERNVDIRVETTITDNEISKEMTRIYVSRIM